MEPTLRPSRDAGSTAISIRPAVPADAPIIARHRAEMFREMHRLDDTTTAQLSRISTPVLDATLRSGEYVGWFACLDGEADRIVAGAGCQRRRAFPHLAVEGGVAEGRHAIVLNVYTEPEWRGRGIAHRLMREVLAWARQERLDRLVLHASAAGRPLYEKLGFVQTNEMRYQASLIAYSDP